MKFGKKVKKKGFSEINAEKDKIKLMAWNLEHVPMFVKENIVNMIDGETEIRDDVIKGINEHKEEIEKNWPKELKEFVFKKIKE